MRSKTLGTNTYKDGTKFVEWIWNYSFHLAVYRLDSSFAAVSVDGQTGQSYDEKETGLFFRPVIAIQPIIHITERFSLSPYFGVGTKLVASYYAWEDKTTISGGDAFASSPESEDDGGAFLFEGLNTNLGMDVGIDIKWKKTTHHVSFGAALSKVFGDNDSDFSEFHFIYSFPL
ncbi:MAG: hypothetical protein HN509_04485 [Halobacteriovoraceae bacterium]|nr:hypothetical protein [Halobacteriovoraceae bacterium]